MRDPRDSTWERGASVTLPAIAKSKSRNSIGVAEAARLLSRGRVSPAAVWLAHQETRARRFAESLQAVVPGTESGRAVHRVEPRELPGRVPVLALLDLAAPARIVERPHPAASVGRADEAVGGPRIGVSGVLQYPPISGPQRAPLRRSRRPRPCGVPT